MSDAPFQPPLLGLKLTPTIAMRRGEQFVWQCAECGLVAVQSDIAPGPLGNCPACGQRHWWRQPSLKKGGSSLAGLSL